MIDAHIDLFKLPGADSAVLDGVEGVFIPKIPNLNVVKFRGRYHALLHVAINPSRNAKHRDYSIYHRPPRAL